MHWYSISDTKNHFKKPKDVCRVELQNFKNPSNYKIFICLLASLPARQPACSPACHKTQFH